MLTFQHINFKSITLIPYLVIFSKWDELKVNDNINLGYIKWLSVYLIFRFVDDICDLNKVSREKIVNRFAIL